MYPCRASPQSTMIRNILGTHTRKRMTRKTGKNIATRNHRNHDATVQLSRKVYTPKPLATQWPILNVRTWRVSTTSTGSTCCPFRRHSGRRCIVHRTPGSSLRRSNSSRPSSTFSCGTARGRRSRNRTPHRQHDSTSNSRLGAKVSGQEASATDVQCHGHIAPACSASLCKGPPLNASIMMYNSLINVLGYCTIFGCLPLLIIRQSRHVEEAPGGATSLASCFSC